MLGRRRKIRCIYTRDSPIECIGCLDRGCRCVNQEFTSIRELRARKTVNERLARLEYLVDSLVGDDSLNDESLQDLDVDPSQISEPGGKRDRKLQQTKRKSDKLPPISSLFENDVWMRIEGKLRSVNEPADGQAGEDEEELIDQNGLYTNKRENDDEKPIPRELRQNKNKRICDAFLAAMPNQARFQDAVSKCAPLWEHVMRTALGPNVTPTLLSLPLFVRWAAQQEDPVALAKALQMVATVMDVQTHERYLSLVNDLIIADHDYMATLGGMEVCFSQGTFFAQIGQAKRSW
jgi:hypothetical protein